MADTEELVTVTRAELEELRKLKEDLPALLQKAKEEGGMDRLKVLNQHHKENPEEHRRKAKQYYELKKDQILAKRKEAYKLKKAGAGSSDRTEKSPGPS